MSNIRKRNKEQTQKKKQLIQQLKENNETLTKQLGLIYNTALYIKINKVIKK